MIHKSWFKTEPWIQLLSLSTKQPVSEPTDDLVESIWHSNLHVPEAKSFDCQNGYGPGSGNFDAWSIYFLYSFSLRCCVCITNCVWRWSWEPRTGKMCLQRKTSKLHCRIHEYSGELCFRKLYGHIWRNTSVVEVDKRHLSVDENWGLRSVPVQRSS